jgi:hypothetical protein
VIVYTSQGNMASRKRKTIEFRTEDELADVVNEMAYYPFIRKTVKWPKKVFFCLL